MELLSLPHSSGPVALSSPIGLAAPEIHSTNEFSRMQWSQTVLHNDKINAPVPTCPKSCGWSQTSQCNCTFPKQRRLWVLVARATDGRLGWSGLPALDEPLTYHMQPPVEGIYTLLVVHLVQPPNCLKLGPHSILVVNIAPPGNPQTKTSCVTFSI